MFDLKKLPVGDDPKKILKVILGLAATFLVLWVLVLTQSNSSGAVSSGNNTLINSDSLSLSVSPQAKRASTSQSGGSIFLKALPVLLILAIIIVFVWYSQKKGPKKSPDLFKIIGRQQLGVGQQIVVMYINEEYWVLAVSGKEISLLDKFSKDEWKGPEKEEKVQYNQFLRIFSEKQQKYAN